MGRSDYRLVDRGRRLGPTSPLAPPPSSLSSLPSLPPHTSSLPSLTSFHLALLLALPSIRPPFPLLPRSSPLSGPEATTPCHLLSHRLTADADVSSYAL